MLSRLARLALFAAIIMLLWNLLLKPETRQRLRGHVQTLAFALLASSVLIAVWEWWQGR